MFIFLTSRLAARRFVHCVGPPSYRKSPIPSFPRFYSSCPASHHAMPAVLFVMPHLASRHARGSIRHSRGSIRHAPPRITPFPQLSRHSRNYHVIPATITSCPRFYSSCPTSHHAIPATITSCPRFYSSCPTSHHAIPATITSFPQPSRHSREGGNLAPHFRRAFLGTPPPRYIERNHSAKIVDRVVAIQVEFSRVAYRNESVVIDAKN